MNSKNILQKVQQFYSKFILLLILIAFSLPAKAQYPVQIIPQLISPYTLSLSDYYTGTSPKLYLTLTNNDLQRPVANVRLRMSISGQLATIVSNDFGNYPTISLDAGIPLRLSLNDFSPYFNPTNLDFTGILTKSQYLTTNKLPEGFYNFCFEAIDVNTKKVVGRSTCVSAWISLNDPPQLNIPANESAIIIAAQNNILFNWLPRHTNSPNSAFSTEYEFELREIWDNAIDPQAAFINAPIIFKSTTTATSIIYGATDPLLIPGKKYAWRVQAKSTNIDDKDGFRNNGYSNVFWFEYKSNCPPPQDYSAEQKYSEMHISISPGFGVTKHQVYYRAKTIIKYEPRYRYKTVTSAYYNSDSASKHLSGWRLYNDSTNAYKILEQTYFEKIESPLEVWYTNLEHSEIANANLIVLVGLSKRCTYDYYVRSVCENGEVVDGPLKSFGFDTSDEEPSCLMYNPNILPMSGKISWGQRYLDYEYGTKNLLDNSMSAGDYINQSAEPHQYETFSLPLAHIKVFTKDYNVYTEIGSGTSSSSGSYSIEVEKKLFEEAYSDSGKIIVKGYPANDFAAVCETIINNPIASQGQLNCSNINLVTSANTFVFEARVTAKDINYLQNKNVNVEVLLSEADWNNRYSKLPFVMDRGKYTRGLKPTTTRYNNQLYYVLAKRTNGNRFYDLMQGYNYVLRVNADGLEPVYDFIDTVNSYCVYKKVIKFELKSSLTGIVTTKGKALNGVIVKINFNNVDKLEDGSDTLKGSTTVFAQTNQLGEYFFNSLPQLKEGKGIVITCEHKPIRNEPWTFNYTIQSTTKNKYDIVLANKVFTFIGRLVDKYNKPIANAQIILGDEVLTNKTSNEGFYLFNSNQDPLKVLKIRANGYDDIVLNLSFLINNKTQSTFYKLDKTNLSTSWQNKIVDAKTIVDYAASSTAFNKSNDVNSEFFGYAPDKALSSIYDELFSNSIDDLEGVYSFNNLQMTNNSQPIKFNIRLNGNGVASQIKIYKIDESESNPYQIIDVKATDDKIIFAGSIAKYKFRIKYTNEQTPFVASVGEFTTNPISNVEPFQEININLENAIVVSGIVTSANGEKMEASSVSIVGLSIKTKTDKNGFYKVVIPQGKELRYTISKANFTSIEDSSITISDTKSDLNFTLQNLPVGIAKIDSIAGFAVEIYKQEKDPNHANVYTVSGALLVNSNAVFEPYAESKKLTFKAVPVKTTTGSTMAFPFGDINFEEAVMQVKVYGFKTEVDGLPRIKLSSLSSAVDTSTTLDGDPTHLFSPAVIVGSNINLRLSRGNNFFKLKDAVLIGNTTHKNGNAVINYLFSSNGSDLDAHNSKYNVFSVVFKESLTSKIINLLPALGRALAPKAPARGADTGYVRASIFGDLVPLCISKTDAVLDRVGINMAGYLQLPAMPGVLVDSGGKVRFEKFIVDKDFNVTELTLNLAKPRVFKIQKIQAVISKISLYGLGTPNMGLGFGGKIAYKKNGGDIALNDSDALIINKFSLINKTNGITLGGSLSLPKKGITINKLKFENLEDAGSAIEFICNFSEKTFVLETQGQITSEDNSNPIMQRIFEKPINIQKFKLTTKDFGIFLAAGANIGIDFKVFKVNITNFLVNIGNTGITLDEMKEYLSDPNYTSPKKKNIDAPFDAAELVAAAGESSNRTELQDNSDIDWAIGISGGVEFPIKLLKVNVNASVLFGNIDSKMQVEVGELGILIDNSPTFKLEAKVKYVNSDSYFGIAARGTLTAMSYGFEADFEFKKYKDAKGGFFLKADVAIELGATGLLLPPPTPVITFYKLGGGLTLDTRNNKFAIRFSGQAGAPGTPKASMYVDIKKLEILFSFNDQCNAGVSLPVVTLDASLHIMNEEWGNVYACADFCRLSMLINVNAMIPIIPKFAKLEANGIIYALAPDTKDGTGSLFTSVNVLFPRAFSDYVQGNAFVALGVNYNNAHPNAPKCIKDIYNLIDVRARSGNIFNGIYANAEIVVPKKSNNFSASIGSLNLASFDYDFFAQGKFMMFYNYNSKVFLVHANAKADANFKAQILAFEFGGGAKILADFEGGYNGSLWHAKAMAAFDLNMFMGQNAGNANCNSFSTACNWLTVPVYHPCCSNPFRGCFWDWSCSWDLNVCVPTLKTKVCLAGNAGLKFKEKQDIQFMFGKDKAPIETWYNAAY